MKTISINETSRVIRNRCHNLEHHLLMTLESSFTIVICLYYGPQLVMEDSAIHCARDVSYARKMFMKSTIGIKVKKLLFLHQ